MRPPAWAARAGLALLLAAALAAGSGPRPAAGEAGDPTRLFLPLVEAAGPLGLDRPIWAHGGSPAAHEVALLRYTLELTEPLVAARWTLFADTHYQAFLDGEPVGRGPVRFSRQRRSVDDWSLGELAAGRHVLAVLAQWAPNSRRSESLRPLVMGHLSGSQGGQPLRLAVTGAAWRARLAPAWRGDAAPVHPEGLIGPTELMDLRRLELAWASPGYADAHWPAATVVADPAPAAAWQARDIPALVEEPVAVAVLDRGRLSPGRSLRAPAADHVGRSALPFRLEAAGLVTVEALGEGGAAPLAPPTGFAVDGSALVWSRAGPARPDVFVASRPLAAGGHLLEAPADTWGDRVLALGGPGLEASGGNLAWSRQAGRRLLLAEHVPDPAAVAVTADGPAGPTLRLGPGPSYAVLDLGRATHGRLTAQVTGPPGAVLDIGWDERLWSGRPLPFRGSLFPGWNQVDSWLLAGGPRPLTTLDARSGRYVLIASWAEGEVVLSGLRVLAERYPASPRGRFASDRPRLDRIWQVGVDTVAVNMLDTFADPWRERGHWWGDAYVEAQVARAAFGDEALFRRGLVLMADGFRGGRPTAIAPGAGPELLDYGMLWVQGLAEHVRQSGDFGLARAEIGTVGAFLGYLRAYEDPASGLLDLPERSAGRLVVLDWGSVKDWGTYYSRYGQSTAVNAMYHGTLASAAELAEAVGWAERAAAWRAEAARLRDRINALLYLPGEHRYLTTRLAGTSYGPWPHAQAWALAYGVVPEPDVPAVADSLVSLMDPDPAAPNVDIYGMYWLLAGLAAGGRVDDGLALIERYYGRLLDLGATTWWESFYSDARPEHSLSHGWGGAPTWFLSSYALGARQTGPRTWQVRLHASRLGRAEGVLPLPTGDLVLAWVNEGCAGTRLTLTAPPGTHGTVAWAADAGAGPGPIALGAGPHALRLPADCRDP